MEVSYLDCWFFQEVGVCRSRWNGLDCELTVRSHSFTVSVGTTQAPNILWFVSEVCVGKNLLFLMLLSMCIGLIHFKGCCKHFWGQIKIQKLSTGANIDVRKIILSLMLLYKNC